MQKNFITLIGTLFMFFPARGQWESCKGPEGGFIYCFAQLGERVFAGSYGHGVWLSEDKGQTWSPALQGFEGFWTRCLITSHGRLYAGTDNGVFHTDDSGKTWKPSCLPGRKVFALADSENGLFVADYDRGLYLLEPEHSEARLILEKQKIRSLQSFPFGVAIGTEEEGLQWYLPGTARKFSRASGLSAQYIRVMAANSSFLIVGSGENGVFLKKGGGKQWLSGSGPIEDYVVFSLFATDTIVFAGTSQGGVFLSRDGARTWTQAGLLGEWVRGIWFDGQNLFAGTYGPGIFISRDLGKSWQLSNKGMVASYPESITCIDSILFCYSSMAGLYRTSDQMNWEQVGFFPGLSKFGAQIHKVGNQWYYPLEAYGLFSSSDSGKTWKQDSLPFPNSQFLDSKSKGSKHFIQQIGGRIFQREFPEKEWSVVVRAEEHIFSFLPTEEYLIFSTNQNGIFRISLDSGKRERTNFPEKASKKGLLFLEADSIIYYRNSSKRLFVSYDIGKSWEPIESGLSIHGAGCMAFGKDLAAVGNDQGELYLKRSGQKNWTRVINNPGYPIYSLYFFGDSLYAGTRGKGVVRIHWRDFTKSLDP